MIFTIHGHLLAKSCDCARFTSTGEFLSKNGGSPTCEFTFSELQVLKKCRFCLFWASRLYFFGRNESRRLYAGHRQAFQCLLSPTRKKGISQLSFTYIKILDFSISAPLSQEILSNLKFSEHEIKMQWKVEGYVSPFLCIFCFCTFFNQSYSPNNFMKILENFY